MHWKAEFLVLKSGATERDGVVSGIVLPILINTGSSGHVTIGAWVNHYRSGAGFSV